MLRRMGIEEIDFLDPSGCLSLGAAFGDPDRAWRDCPGPRPRTRAILGMPRQCGVYLPRTTFDESGEGRDRGWHVVRVSKEPLFYRSCRSSPPVKMFNRWNTSWAPCIPPTDPEPIHAVTAHECAPLDYRGRDRCRALEVHVVRASSRARLFLRGLREVDRTPPRATNRERKNEMRRTHLGPALLIPTHGISANTRAGLPVPPRILIGAAKRIAPLAGSWSTLARLARPNLPAPSMT